MTPGSPADSPDMGNNVPDPGLPIPPPNPPGPAPTQEGAVDQGMIDESNKPFKFPTPKPHGNVTPRDDSPAPPDPSGLY